MIDTVGLLCAGYLLLDRAGIAQLSNWGALLCWVAVVLSSSSAVRVRVKQDD